MRRVYDGGREGVCDGHGAGNDAFNRWREAAGLQGHHSGGIPGEERERGKERERHAKLSHQSTTETEITTM